MLQLSCHKCYRFIITDLVRSYYIESTSKQLQKSAPLFISTSQCGFNGARSCAHARLTIFFSLNRPLLKYQYLHCVENLQPAISLIAPYKVLPFSEIILKLVLFSSPLPPFQTFMGLREPGTNTLFEHTLVCLINYLFLHGFQSNLHQQFYVSSTCETTFSQKQALECI